MPKYPGRIISATPPSVSASGASGVWTTEEVAQYEQAGTWPVATGSDPNFNQTVLLLHGDGTNGAQNNTFLDGSTNNFTITRSGNTTQGTFSPFSVGAGEWSVASDGSGDNLSIAYDSALDVTQGDFTVEFWIYRTVGGVQLEVINQRGSTIGWIVRINSNNTIVFAYAGSGANVTSIGTIPLNEWVHVAGAREGNTIRVFINGVLDNTGSGGNGTTSTATFYINRSYISSGTGVTGYLSNLRIVKGTALYTTDFTVPTTPLTAVSGTSLLTLQDNRFVDNSTNNFAITAVGNIAASSFSPFAPTAAYSAGTNGGSGYFDGSGDRLSLTNNSAFDMGSGDFTIECWFYMTGNSPQNNDGTRGASLFNTFPNSGSVSTDYNLALSGNSTTTGTALSFFRRSSGTLTSLSYTATITQQTWHHVAVVRSGSNLTLYYDGAQVAQNTSFSGNVDTGGNPIKIGATAYFPGGTGYENPIVGYISGLKVIKGTAVTPSGVPTTPPVDSSGTSLLCNFTNAGIIDNTGKNVLETVDNAQIDTTTKKYGTGSMEFDGTDDSFRLPNSYDFAFGTGDFTIEFWMYANASTGHIINMGAEATISSGSQVSFEIKMNTANSLRHRVFFGSTVVVVADSAISQGTWIHVALVRNGSTFTAYHDGVSVGTATNSGSLNFNTAWPVKIGRGAGTGAGDPIPYFNGFIDDLRITKGVARYTANFTPPTAAFLDQ